jgi:predicted phosphodiesterase
VRLRRLLGRAVAGAAGAHLGLLIGPPARRRVGPVGLAAAVRPGAGGTLVDLGPLGTAALHSHGGRLRLIVRVDEVTTDVDVAALRGLTPASLRSEATPLLLDAAARAAAAATAGGLLAGGVLTRRTAGAFAAGGYALVGVSALAGWAGLTRDATALRDPQLSGLLRQAPSLLGDLRTAPERLDKYGRQLSELLQTATAVRDRVSALPDPPPADAIRLVHISDIHLSPLALPLVRAVVEQYRADLVVDTGDLVDWGTPPEQALADRIGELEVPYVFVKGNHDSEGIADAVARQPNATVLRGDTTPVEVAGLRFVGLPDPRFTPDKTTGHDRAGDLPASAATTFAAELRAAGAVADIALVHSPAGARRLAGLVPLVLSGDTHVRAHRELDGTLLLTQGTTGGAGLRGVQTDPPPPFALSVLHIDRSTRRLHSVDELTLDGLGGTGATVRRRRAAELAGSR